MKHFHLNVFLCAALTALSMIADAQNTYADCCTNFTTLENALLETSDNVFQLTTAYYNLDSESPIYVDVRYYFSNSSPPAHYVWSAATVFFIIDPYALRFLSIFYGYFGDERKLNLTLQLPANCAELSNVTSSTKDNLLFILTQRVSILVHETLHGIRKKSWNVGYVTC